MISSMKMILISYLSVVPLVDNKLSDISDLFDYPI